MVLQKAVITVLNLLSAYHMVIAISEDSETEYYIYSDISTRNDTKQRWQPNSCHAIPFYFTPTIDKEPFFIDLITFSE